MKRKNFDPLPRHIFDEKYRVLTGTTKWVYTTLVECEHIYTNEKDGKDGWFFQSDEGLAAMAGTGVMTIRRAKKALEEVGLIETEVRHTPLPGGRKSERQITYYRICDPPIEK